MRLADSHAHLDSPRFRDDLPEVVARARRSGVETILTVGCLGPEPDTAGRVLEIVKSFPGVVASFGIHPHDARLMSDRLERELIDLLRSPNVRALGEIGLDYHYDNSPRDVQREVFRRQVRLARGMGMPIIVHTREAEEDTLRILEEETGVGNASPPGVLHCFSGTPGFAEAGVSLGYFVSFGGIVTFKMADEVRDALDRVPDNRLLVETDAPYLAPVPMRGKRNEPAFVGYVAEEIARRRGCSPSRIASLTRSNFAVLLGTERYPEQGTEEVR
jgi:TatD DNase family protein